MRRNRVKLFFIALTVFFLTCFGAAKAVSPRIPVPASPPKDEKPALPPNDIFEVFNQETIHRFSSVSGGRFGMSRVPWSYFYDMRQRSIVSWKGTKTTILINPDLALKDGLTYEQAFEKTRHYQPETPGEQRAIAALEKDGWKFGIYLFGRLLDVQKAPAAVGHGKEFKLRYRLNTPLTGTSFTRLRHLVPPKKLIPQVNDAFEAFLEGKERYDFTVGQRTLIAIPVRTQASCLQCHRGPFVTRVLGDDPKKPKLQYRERRVGDTIGILVYSFEKR